VQMNALSNGIPVIRNGGRAKVDGAEAQLAWRATRGLALGASLGLNHARITALDADTAAATGARPGDALPNSPRITAALWADQVFALFGHEASVGASVKHTGKKPASYSADALNVPTTVPAFTTLDLRALWRLGRTTLRVSVDNATDKNGISGYNTLQVFPGTVATSTAWLIRPRTLSASIAYDF
jgi:iron complex outermembrane recepter protein